MIFTKETWKIVGEKYAIYDCAIRSKDRQCFLMYEIQSTPHREVLPRTQFLFTYNDETDPSERYYFSQFGNFDFSRIAYCPEPIPNYVSVDVGCNVFGYDKNHDGEEQGIPRQLIGSELALVITQVARVGSSIYAVGSARRMFKRLGVNQWQDMTTSLPLPSAYTGGDETTIMDFVWNSVHGFSETDIYAVGGAGDVWNFDGTKWKQCNFPSNERLNNVFCANNGMVYIGGNMGSLFVGKSNTWKKVHDGGMVMPWKDVAWFADKLWCGSDYGLWTLDGEKFSVADVPADVKLASGSIDISPDGHHMLTAGPNGASLFDGTTWKVLFSRHDLED